MTAIELLFILAAAVAVLWAVVGITDACASRRSRPAVAGERATAEGAAE
ncbi:hypothetical protein ACIO6T_41270 [Streptomyces sp. NPDC087532]